MYTIRSGDTMNAIAQRHGVSLQALLGANPQVRNPSLIHAGSALRIPGSAAAAPTTTARNPTSPGPTLRRGMTGQAVRELQRQLQALGYLSAGDVASGPGVFGPRTEAAVMAFQSRHNIRRTGVVADYTRNALATALRGGSPAPAPSTSPTSSAGYPPRYNGTRPAAGTTNTRAWEPVDAPLRSDTSNRSAARYADVLNQFAVAANPRYARRNGNTYCNIFVWDVTRAMGAELPHWVNGRELNANAVSQWLNTTGPSKGWRKVDAATAQQYANAGRPSVASWRNPNGIGHIAMVRPGTLTAGGPAIAQAGSRNFNDGHVADGFGNARPEYWVHA